MTKYYTNSSFIIIESNPLFYKTSAKYYYFSLLLVGVVANNESTRPRWCCSPGLQVGRHQRETTFFAVVGILSRNLGIVANSEN